MGISSLYLNVTDLDLYTGAVRFEAGEADFGVEMNTTINSICSALTSESEVLSVFWQILLLTSNALNDYRDLVYKDMRLVQSAADGMINIDNVMSTSVATMSAQL